MRSSAVCGSLIPSEGEGKLKTNHNTSTLLTFFGIELLGVRAVLDDELELELQVDDLSGFKKDGIMLKIFSCSRLTLSFDSRPAGFD